MQNEIVKKDYEIAAESAAELYSTLGLTCQISQPIGDVRDNWPNILYNVIFSKDGKNLSQQYRLGVGHVTWPKRFEDIPKGGDVSVFNTLRHNPHAELKNKSEHAIAAALLARVQKVAPKPFEVLAAVCDDGFSAHNESWESYAGNFGVDRDSIKDKRIYDQCCEVYHQVVNLIGREAVEKLAELRAQF